MSNSKESLLGSLISCTLIFCYFCDLFGHGVQTGSLSGTWVGQGKGTWSPDLISTCSVAYATGPDFRGKIITKKE